MRRDSRGRSAPPSNVGEAVRRFSEELAPETPLGSIQAVWPRVVGEGIAAVTTVLAEREGQLEIGCESAVWAEELSLMEPEIRVKLNRSLPDGVVESIKFRAGG